MLQRLQAAIILIGLWFVNLAFRFITVRGTWRIGEWLGYITYKTLPGRRSVVRYNLEIVGKAHPKINITEKLILDVFKRSAANLVCSIKTYGMSPEQLSNIVTINVHPAFSQAIKDQSGAVLTLAHMGNWEILSKISSLIQPEPKNFGAVYRPLDNKIVDSYVAKQRTKFGCLMFSKKTSVSKLSSFIKQGGILGILADQRSGSASKNARDFFSKPTPRSKLPAVLARRTNAPLFSVAVYSETKGRWSIDITPVSISNTEETETIVDAVSQSYEQLFIQHIIDVFWLHRYWNSNINKHAKR